MTVVSRTLRYVDIGLTGLAVLFAVGTLLVWARAVMWWGDPAAFASALGWTILTLVTVGVGAVVERLRPTED